MGRVSVRVLTAILELPANSMLCRGSRATHLVHNLTWHAGWNCVQYGEKDFVGPTVPRYFHVNDMTVSLKYAF
jgi:hypothetical protein